MEEYIHSYVYSNISNLGSSVLLVKHFYAKKKKAFHCGFMTIYSPAFLILLNNERKFTILSSLFFNYVQETRIPQRYTYVSN